MRGFGRLGATEASTVFFAVYSGKLARSSLRM